MGRANPLLAPLLFRAIAVSNRIAKAPVKGAGSYGGVFHPYSNRLETDKTTLLRGLHRGYSRQELPLPDRKLL